MELRTSWADCREFNLQRHHVYFCQHRSCDPSKYRSLLGCGDRETKERPIFYAKNSVDRPLGCVKHMVTRGGGGDYANRRPLRRGNSFTLASGSCMRKAKPEQDTHGTEGKRSWMQQSGSRHEMRNKKYSKVPKPTICSISQAPDVAN